MSQGKTDGETITIQVVVWSILAAVFVVGILPHIFPYIVDALIWWSEFPNKLGL